MTKKTKSAVKAKTTLLCWTQGYRPFICGGNVNAPIGAEFEVGELHDIGRGYKAYLIPAGAPGKPDLVAESTTGAVVGNSLKEVREDISKAKLSVMRKQIAQAKLQMKEVHPLTPDELWQALGDV